MLASLVQGTFDTVVAVMQRALFLQRSTYASLWAGYCSSLQKRPILTKAATGIVGSLIGDGLAQYAEGRSKPRAAASYDAARASRLCAYAAVVGSPVGHYWFHFLDKFIWPHAMGSPAAVIAKVLLDQAFMAPLGIALFFQVMGMLEGNTAHQAFQSTKEKFWPTVKANYMLWPAANAINFAFVPPAQRILYCNVVYVFWASYLSAMASKKDEPVDQVKYDQAYAHKEL